MKTLMDDATTSNDLLGATARGDRAAFHALYDRSSAKLFGVVLRICREQALAEDALQDAFVEIWRKADRFDPNRGRAETWMAVIARNRAIDALRKRGRAPTPLGRPDDDAEDPVANLVDPTQRTDGGAERIALETCMERLDERQREMVRLAYLDGYSREDLAARFDAPVNTVKTWLRRGLASLKTCLGE